MSEVASRDLRNNTADLLRRVAGGEEVVITLNGKAVARLVPVQPSTRRWLPRAEFLDRLERNAPDPGLVADLAWISSDTTDDLGPIR